MCKCKMLHIDSYLLKRAFLVTAKHLGFIFFVFFSPFAKDLCSKPLFHISWFIIYIINTIDDKLYGMWVYGSLYFVILNNNNCISFHFSTFIHLFDGKENFTAHISNSRTLYHQTWEIIVWQVYISLLKTETYTLDSFKNLDNINPLHTIFVDVAELVFSFQVKKTLKLVKSVCLCVCELFFFRFAK